MTETAQQVLDFWRAAGRAAWFTRSDAFDTSIREQFLPLYETFTQNDNLLKHRHPWENTANGALALTIVLDQFPRQMFRAQARAFAADPLARAVAGRALDAGYDRQVETALRGFFYLPFMHSEDLADQDRCVTLYQAAGDEDGLNYAHIHRDVIVRFGRFPHRNSALGRETLDEEQQFLDNGGFAA